MTRRSVSFLAISLGALAIYDLLQKRHAIIRNFPIVGHLRYALESIGPELRQYIVTDNDSERPFNRDQRRWIYASSKRDNDLFGFGTDNDVENAEGYLVIRHATMPRGRMRDGDHSGKVRLPCGKVLGASRGRKKAFRPASVVNISALSFGSLSGPAIEALNKGAALADCLHNTGEGGLSRHHRHGGELVFQIGTGYFGCRDENGRFSMDRLLETISQAPVRAIEIKLSQGAKPGIGGILPAAKVSREIAEARGVPVGRDCVSPPAHTAFSDADSLLDFVEEVADATGLPVGIKSAVGELDFWYELADFMVAGDRGVDFVTIDGGEGGTGAGPLVFSDHVALPFRLAFSRVYKIFAERELTDRVVFVGSGKLGLPENALLAMALGCDMINVGREAMMAIGCIQAQRCHTNRCPTGVATQNRWLAGGLDPTLKSVRLANYVEALRAELLRLAHACGVEHPALVDLDRIEFVDRCDTGRSARELFGYEPGWGSLSAEMRERLQGIMRAASAIRGR
ncbi:MAG: FMN-binding glutamate synthase family protein [Acidimicrobiales bacterium]|nr:MAG: FMN-binding glutamate synthase family protein [Acidimicrobiales bacterium]